MRMSTGTEPAPRGEMRYILTLEGVVAQARVAAGVSVRGVAGRNCVAVRSSGFEPSRVTKPRALW